MEKKKTIKDLVDLLLVKQWRLLVQEGDERVFWRSGEWPVIIYEPDEKELTDARWIELVRKYKLFD